jgi:hypothetical protein
MTGGTSWWMRRQGKSSTTLRGYGYRTAHNAHRAYSYKSMPAKQKSQPNAVERKVERWCAAHKEFMGHLEQAMFYAMKDGDSFTRADVEQLLCEHSLELGVLDPGPDAALVMSWVLFALSPTRSWLLPRRARGCGPDCGWTAMTRRCSAR